MAETGPDLVHIPPNPDGSSAASGANLEAQKPKHNHAYNRKCKAFVPTHGWRRKGLYRICNEDTARGKLYCEKHSGKE